MGEHPGYGNGPPEGWPTTPPQGYATPPQPQFTAAHPGAQPPPYPYAPPRIKGWDGGRIFLNVFGFSLLAAPVVGVLAGIGAAGLLGLGFVASDASIAESFVGSAFLGLTFGVFLGAIAGLILGVPTSLAAAGAAAALYGKRPDVQTGWLAGAAAGAVVLLATVGAITWYGLLLSAVTALVVRTVTARILRRAAVDTQRSALGGVPWEGSAPPPQGPPLPAQPVWPQQQQPPSNQPPTYQQPPSQPGWPPQQPGA